MMIILSAIRRKGQSQNGCCQRTKPAEFSEKQLFLTPWYAHAFYLITGDLRIKHFILRYISSYLNFCIWVPTKFYPINSLTNNLLHKYYTTCNIVAATYFYRKLISPFSINVPHLDEPGSWFLLAKCLKKHLWKSDILSKDAGLKVNNKDTSLSLDKLVTVSKRILNLLNLHILIKKGSLSSLRDLVFPTFA